MASAVTASAGENKRKHLEFIQDVINRMARNSFMLKGWTVLVVAAIIAFIARGGDIRYIFAVCLVILAFWILDGFFLWQERLFRALYDHVRVLEEDAIDFSMDTRQFAKENRNRWHRAIFSRILLIFYLCVCLVVFILPILKVTDF